MWFPQEQSKARFGIRGLQVWGWVGCEDYVHAGSYPAEDFILWASGEQGWNPQQISYRSGYQGRITIPPGPRQSFKGYRGPRGPPANQGKGKGGQGQQLLLQGQLLPQGQQIPRGTPIHHAPVFLMVLFVHTVLLFWVQLDHRVHKKIPTGFAIASTWSHA